MEESNLFSPQSGRLFQPKVSPWEGNEKYVFGLKGQVNIFNLKGMIGAELVYFPQIN